MECVRCALVSNPASGTGREDRLSRIQAVGRALSADGHSVAIELTTAPGSASAQAREAANNGVDVVFACGGDGTVHEVIQGLVAEDGSPVAALGIVPVGSANALARHLRLPLDPVNAALAQIRGCERTIPVGKLECDGQTRYFTVMAGAGPDGALVYKMLTAQKRRLGRSAYYLRAAHLFATRGFPHFGVEYLQADSMVIAQGNAVALMSVRVGDLGGLFGGLTSRTASIEASELELYFVRRPAWLSLPLWFVSSWLGLQRHNPLLKHVKTAAFECRPLNEVGIDVQADGEWIGRAPFRVSIMLGALRIRMPLRSSTPPNS
jgi:YegS/Rv2252/BmrU family lipid kinase